MHSKVRHIGSISLCAGTKCQEAKTPSKTQLHCLAIWTLKDVRKIPLAFERGYPNHEGSGYPGRVPGHTEKTAAIFGGDTHFTRDLGMDRDAQNTGMPKSLSQRHIGLFIARPGYSSLAQQNTPALQAIYSAKTKINSTQILNVGINSPTTENVYTEMTKYLLLGLEREYKQ